MSNQNDIERIRRLRERQLQARDPKKKQREHERRVSHKFEQKNDTLFEMLRQIPITWWGTILGGMLGFVIALVFDQVLKIRPIPQIDAFWTEYLWYMLVFVGIAVGRLLGAVLDWQGEDHDKLVVRGRK